MGLLNMSDKEFELYRSFLSEAMKLQGQDASVFPVGTVVEDLNSDKDITFENERKVGILFESNPRPILKKMGWMVEDGELPYVVYILSKDKDGRDFEVKEGMLVRVDSKRVLESTRYFDISSVRGVTIDPLMWICKMVPHRGEVDFRPELTGVQENLDEKRGEMSYKYLKR